MLSRRLEITANVALIVTCATFVYVLVSRKASVQSPPIHTSPGYQTGETIDKVVNFDPAASERTLLMLVGSSCQFCTESMPFYKDLLTTRRDNDGLRFVALSRDSPAVIQAYLSEYGLSTDQILTVPGNFRARSTPTLILIDRSGKVLNIWRGLLSRAKEHEVQRAISGFAERG